MNTRKEEDLLGFLDINNDAFYGIHTQRAINNFQISKFKISDYPIFITGMVLTKKACACANKELGTVSSEKADMIIEAVTRFLII